MPAIKDKFRGCIAASWIGSAMGAAVEGWSPEEIESEYGFLDRLLAYRHYTEETNWKRPAGTTEDGIERQKLIATAIIEKKDRILAHDLVGIWLRDLEPRKMLFKQEAFDRSLLEMARAGVPPSELGKLWPYPNVVSVARSSHPLGLINAGDPKGAADDSFEVGKVYCRETHFALRWAALYNAALAEACRPGANVASVLATARKFSSYRAEGGKLYSLYDTVGSEVDQAMEIMKRSGSITEMRRRFYRIYIGGGYFNYGFSQANEVVSKGLAIFGKCKGKPKETILAAVNFGRDTDCLAAVAGGLAGALAGASSLPQKWVSQVNFAVRRDPYTNNRRTVEQTADGIYRALKARRRRLMRYAGSLHL